MSPVIIDRVRLLTLKNFCLILFVVQVKVILYVHVLAEVGRKVVGPSNLDYKVNPLPHEVGRTVGNYFFWEFSLTIGVAGNHINL